MRKLSVSVIACVLLAGCGSSDFGRGFGSAVAWEIVGEALTANCDNPAGVGPSCSEKADDAARIAKSVYDSASPADSQIDADQLDEELKDYTGGR